MADRSHLTAVPTTDRRGRATTVYRNLGGKPSAAARALPAVPPAPAARTVEPVQDYRGAHRAPTDDGYSNPITRLADSFGDDVLDHPEYYGSGTIDAETLAQLKRVAADPDATVRVYRAVPHGIGEINKGDWVTLSEDYARQHAIQDDDEANDWPIINAEVPARAVFTDGNDLAEYGYDGEPLVGLALPDPTPLSRGDLEAVARRLAKQWYELTITREQGEALSSPGSPIWSGDGARAAALAAGMTAAGILPERDALAVLAVALSRQGGTLALDALRVAGEVSDRLPERYLRWGSDVVAATLGRRDEPEGIATVAQRDSTAAAVEFTLRVSEVRPDLIEHGHYGGGEHYSITDRALEDLVRDYPREVDRILAHVGARGARAKGQWTADKLRRLLESDTAPALDDGWL